MAKTAQIRVDAYLSGADVRVAAFLRSLTDHVGVKFYATVHAFLEHALNFVVETRESVGRIPGRQGSSQGVDAGRGTSWVASKMT